MYDMMYGYGYGGGPDFFFFHAISWIFWIVLIVIAIRLLRGPRHWRHSGWWDGGAMNTLRDRYAKGEISKEEFEAKKKDLMS